MHDVDAKVLDHALGHHRADALDQPGPQIPLDALDGRGQHGGVGEHLELLAVPGMRDPSAAHPQGLAHLRAQQRADHRQQVRTTPGIDPGGRVPGLRVSVGDSLQGALENRAITGSWTRRHNGNNGRRMNDPASPAAPSRRGRRPLDLACRPAANPRQQPIH